MSLLFSAYFGLGLLLALGLVAAALRQRAYRRNVSFKPKYDCQYDFSQSTGNELFVEVNSEGFTLPKDARDYDTGFLELRVAASFFGRFLDPSMELSIGAERSDIFFERGATGLRHINVSPFLQRSGRICARGRHMRWKTGPACVRLWKNAPLNNERVLIVAPHPDDAEIAAHSLYVQTQAHIVTICAGDRSIWNLSKIEPRRERRSELSARLRVWDAMTIPGLAGVPPEHSIQLAYPDDGLAKMRAAPDQNFSLIDFDFEKLRRLNRGGFELEAKPICSWNSLVKDLRQVFARIRPTVIVLPSPKYDNHSDHGFTTMAVCEALSTLPDRPGRFLLYINHGLLTEHWPFGPAGTIVSLPPNRDNGMRISALWSRPLSADEQRDKFLALEAMHDLRETPRTGIRTWAEIFKEMRGEIGTKVHGMERRPNNYFRRAVRANELFFLATYDDVQSDAQKIATEAQKRSR